MKKLQKHQSRKYPKWKHWRLLISEGLCWMLSHSYSALLHFRVGLLEWTELQVPENRADCCCWNCVPDFSVCFPDPSRLLKNWEQQKCSKRVFHFYMFLQKYSFLSDSHSLAWLVLWRGNSWGEKSVSSHNTNLVAITTHGTRPVSRGFMTGGSSWSAGLTNECCCCRVWIQLCWSWESFCISLKVIVGIF